MFSIICFSYVVMKNGVQIGESYNCEELAIAKANELNDSLTQQDKDANGCYYVKHKESCFLMC